VTDRSSPGELAPTSWLLRVVPDANAFTGYAWVDRFIRESERGRIQIFWSPKILEEVGRVRLWIWIKRVLRDEPTPTGSSAWKALWERYSEEAHSWFARISPLVQVIEDQPPHEVAWADPHPDPDDAWLWNTARRVRADVVLTVNLRDGPPADAVGVRTYEGVTYIHPGVFLVLLDIVGGIYETERIPDDLVDHVRRIIGPRSNLNPSVVAAHLRVILGRIAEERSAE
jgi:hypothetical protein